VHRYAGGLFYYFYLNVNHKITMVINAGYAGKRKCDQQGVFLVNPFITAYYDFYCKVEGESYAKDMHNLR
ncbi:hypothetical protein, partial [Citrobacter koseri]|uniref:hypothetical protein n=1 Tax=Citrobacter koseri TaxID=545 RepID=UPI00200A0242